jgi:hypothetical protein
MTSTMDNVPQEASNENAEPVAETATQSAGVPTIEAEEPAPAATQAPVEENVEFEEAGVGTEGGAKKLISLRVAPEDLELAKSLAPEFEVGYQTLLNQIIHRGLRDAQAEVKTRQLVAQLQSSLPALQSARELLDTPAVKAAQELLSNPAVKAAQELMNNPVLKAAQGFADEVAKNPAVQQVRDFSVNSYHKAAEELSASPLAKALKDLAEAPALKAAQELAETTSAKLVRDVSNSPVGRFSRELAQAAGVPVPAPGEELQQLNKAVDEIRDALKKARLM